MAQYFFRFFVGAMVGMAAALLLLWWTGLQIGFWGGVAVGYLFGTLGGFLGVRGVEP